MEADERDLLLARRLKLGVRLVIYPMLLAFVAVALHVRSNAHADPDTGPPIREWRATSPLLAGPASAQTDGVLLTWFRADLIEHCPGGADFTYQWAANGAMITQRGAAVTIDHHFHGRADDGGPMDAYVHVGAAVGDGAVSATVSGWTIWTRASDGLVVKCESDDIDVVLRPQAAG